MIMPRAFSSDFAAAGTAIGRITTRAAISTATAAGHNYTII